jgi:tetratricopeptide (TPR) repeat protein
LPAGDAAHDPAPPSDKVTKLVPPAALPASDTLGQEAKELYIKGMYNSAKDKSLEWSEAAASEYGPGSGRALEARIFYARALMKAGYFPEAAAYCRELASEVEKAFGAGSAETMELEDVLGYSILYQDRDEEAYQYFSRLDMQRRGYLPDGSPERFIASRAHIQARRAADHDAPEDVQELRDLLARQAGEFGERDPEVLETRLQLASAIYEDSVPVSDGFDYSEVDSLVESIRKAREEIYGPVHPDVSEAMALTGFLRQLQGKLPEARDILARVSEIEGQTLGPDHPWSVNSYLALAWIATQSGNGAETRDWYAKALASRLSFYGGESEKSCEARIMLAEAYSDLLNDYPKALEQLEKALEWREKSLGPEHAETLRALTEIAEIHVRTENLDEARSVYDRILKIRTSALGPDHPDTIQSAGRVAYSQFLEGNLAQARALYEDLHRRSLSALGPNHRETINARVSLAMVLNGLGENAEATRLLQAALESLGGETGPESPDSLTVKAYLAKVFFDTGEKEKAFRFSSDTLASRERVLGEGHADTVASRAQLAEILTDRGDWAAALPLLQKVTAWRTERLGADDRSTLAVRTELAEAYRNLGDKAAAREAYISLVKDAERVLGRNNPSTERLRNELALVF